MTQALAQLSRAAVLAHCLVQVSRAAVLAHCLVLLFGARALAQGDYHQLLKDAEREIADGEPATARDLYRRALVERETAAVFYGIAITSQSLADEPEAVRMARAALAKHDGTIKADNEAVLRALIEAALPRVAELVVESDPPEVQIAVDGQVVPRGPEGEIVVWPGRRTVRALAEGYMPYLTELDLPAGRRQTLTVELVQPNRPVGLYRDEDDEAQEDDDGPSLVVPIVLVSIGGATLLAGGITGIVALDNEGDLENRCGEMPSQCPKTNTAVAHSAEDLALATNVLWVVGGLTTAVGLTWLILALSDDEHAATASFDLGPDRARLQLAGHF